ncbi:MAG TPA: type II toxin-antitoxin system PemK/MazF family toxin [Candidatus Limosilactobacillus intestinigallinarum]|jgi:mRNA interferase MazF|nr:type II toxin-antitoxin system PemK/MazF family toxin [Candidatus Limosilactobacillus intestinigallinarum]
MKNFHQGDIVWVDLDPAKGNETKKKRPCVVVSNEQYNHYFNTILVIPISSSEKYLSMKKYRVSPLFVRIDHHPIYGTALLQHIRAVDPGKRTDGKVVAQTSPEETRIISQRLVQFF